MRSEPEAPGAAEEVPAWDGPDPRDWPARPEIWDLVRDIETVDHVIGVMNGPIAQEGGPFYHEARRFLAQMGWQLRGELALVLLASYGVKAGEASEASPFSAAGKPRAFGVDSHAPPTG